MSSIAIDGRSPLSEPAQAVGAELYAQNKVLGMLFVLAEYISADLPGIAAG